MLIREVTGADISGKITAEGKGIIAIKTSLKTAEKLLNGIKKDKAYNIEVKQHRKNRSLDANAYCWVLCGKLAEKLGITDVEVYQQQIRHYGVSVIRPEKEDLVDELVRMWDAMGIGNSHDILGESKLRGYVNVKYYYGSRNYDTKRMSRLIDGLVYECESQGIETLTPDEIERMKSAWGTG